MAQNKAAVVKTPTIPYLPPTAKRIKITTPWAHVTVTIVNMGWVQRGYTVCAYVITKI